MKNFTNYVDYDKKENLKMGSKLVHGALGTEPLTGSVSFPIFQTATFRFRGLEDSLGYDYTRCQNPTIEELERTMAILEEGTEGFRQQAGGYYPGGAPAGRGHSAEQPVQPAP